VNVSRDRCRGFTLLEILVVLVLASGIIVALAQLYGTVATAGILLRSGNSDFAAEQFMRRQTLQAFSLETRPFQFHAERDVLLFSTRHSLVSGIHGAPVVAYYFFDRSRRALIYREAPAPPWWQASGQGQTSLQAPPTPTIEAQLGNFRSGTGVSEPQTVLYGITNLEWAFLTGLATDNIWLDRWTFTDKKPALLRLRYWRGGAMQELVFELSAPFAVSTSPG